MSDTPRTDALNHRTYSCGKGYRLAVHADLCRELERELASVTAERDELKELNYRYTSALWERGDELAAATAERDELLKDKARLDAMQAMGGRWEATHGIWGKHSGLVFLSNSVSDGAQTVREAIDKWMEVQP
jgi:hypothetical protein